MTEPPSAGQLRRLRRRLLDWFDANRRDLPWRRDRDPYRVWVSEVMLQQTTAAAAGPYFERFVALFPTAADLAAAPLERVLKAWEGLGYYSRARNLHAAAKLLAERHAGGLPDDPAVWAALPGVGRYILGAVLSQAFGRRLPIVEANSKRVLCRLFGRRGDPAAAAGQKWLWQAAERVLPSERCGDFNQALMELGALVCKPKGPRCGDCPLAELCAAKRDGTQAEIPAPAARPAVTQVREAAVVVRRTLADGERVLLARRPESGRWAGMWEFPHAELAADESHADAARRLLGALGVRADLGTELLTVRHGITRFAVTMVCLEARHVGGEFAPGLYPHADWVTAEQLGDYPVSSPQRKLALELAKPRRQGRLF